MNHIANITIQPKEEDIFTIVQELPISVLCPNPKWRRPYSSSGKDAESLQLVIKNKIGCQIEDEAIRFEFDPSKESAVLSVNKSLIHFDEDTYQATVICLLSGNYSFNREVTLRLSKPASPGIVLSPQLLLDDDGNPVTYYIGQGEASIGTLSVTCKKNDPHISDDGYLPVDLTKSRPVCNNTSLVLKLKSEDSIIRVGERVVYDMFLDLSEDFQVEQDENGNIGMSFAVSINDALSTSFRVPIEQQRKTLFLRESTQHSIVFAGKCSYHFYDIILRYNAPAEEDFSSRHHRGGIISISGDEHVSFVKTCIEQELPINTIRPGDNPISVFFIAPDEWSNIKNIQSDYVLNNIRVKYAEREDSSSHTYEDSIRLSSNKIARLDDTPQLVVFCTDQKGNEIIVFSDSPESEAHNRRILFTGPDIEYSPNNSIYRTDPPFSLYFRNAQTLNNNKRLSIRNIKCTSNNRQKIRIDDFSIVNGGRDVDISIAPEIDSPNRLSNIISFEFDLYRDENGPLHIPLYITIPRKLKTDIWHSLDLGTSGIVVAGFDGDKGQIMPRIITLRDEDEYSRIEKEEGILSAATIVKNDDPNGMGALKIAPTRGDLFSSMRVLPCKFLAGRKVLPMVNSYINRFPQGLRIEGIDYFWEEDGLVKNIITETYSDVFHRISQEESNNVQKLVVTYPNTYSPFLINELRKLIIEKGLFPNLLQTDLSFVPESDAVIAYYVNDAIINGEGFGSDNKQTIVVYDMGAGTLDLSLATLEKKESKLIITIDKRLGVPIGGAYITEVLYHFLESEGVFSSYGESEDSKKESRRKRLELTEEVKFNFGNGKIFRSEDDDRSVLNRDCDIDESTFESCHELNDIIELCTNGVFRYLTGVENWEDGIDKVIISGRGSLFNPIREGIKNNIGEGKVYPIEQLKTCVAIGAIQYQRISKNLDDRFEISHKNSYQNIGIYYRFLKDDFKAEYDYCEIVSSNNARFNDRENPEFGVLEGHNTSPIDLSLTQDAIIFASPFDRDTMKEILKSEDDIRRSMITHLLSFNTNSVNNRKSVTISIMSDIDGNLSIKFNGAELNTIQLVERIEDNKYYQHYFNVNR